jgi:LPPG:FO 2-phospho-L-lactate transferase
MSAPVIALCGGVGGAKLAHGLSLILPPEELMIIVNTGDDFCHLGLNISPDLDAVVYALAGLSDPIRGWGRREETWTCLNALAGLGAETWFQLGDADLAIHILRTAALARGATLTELTASVCTALGVRHPVIPMSDDPVHTQLLTDEGWLEFQEYFVHRQCAPRLQALRFAGCESARPQERAIEMLQRADLRAIVICPSNPFVSIAPILAIPALRTAIEHTAAPVLAVTPIIGGKAVKGPAGKMLAELGLPVTAEAVAAHYVGLVDAFITDASDPPAPGPAGMRMLRAQTLMHSAADRVALAQVVLAAADSRGRVGTS